MRRLCSVFLALLMLQDSASAAPLSQILVVVRRDSADSLAVEYTLPADCTRVPFLKNGVGAGKIRSRWQSLDGGTASSETLTRSVSSPQVLRFRVPATTDKVTGYPGSFPVGDAIYAHMSNYAIGVQCGAVRYAFAANGSVETSQAIFDGQTAAGADAPALLFLKRRRTGSELDYLDPALSPAAAGQIRKVANDTAAFLRSRMPKAQFTRPIIAAALASEPGGPNIGGSAGDVLLLSLFNWPPAPSPALRRQMYKLVSHEMSHRFQMRDAVDVYPDARLIHEGGAEFLRWAASLQMQWLTPDQAGAELNDALAACMLATRDRSWSEISQSEISVKRLEYSCGLPVYVYGLATRHGDGSPFTRIDDFYSRLRAGHRPEFLTAVECGRLKCRPRIPPTLLTGHDSMRDQWSAALDGTRLAVRKVPTQSQTDAMMLQAITDLVKADCDGESSMTPTAETLLIDGLTACHTVHADIAVARVEDEWIFGGRRALPAMVAACRARRMVRLGFVGGGSMSLPCREPYRTAQYFYAADMPLIMRLLAGSGAFKFSGR